MARTAHRRVSVKDVALAAGVSTQTVSRVVNNATSVAPATRERVEAAIAQLGYRRSELARNLILGRTRTLGIVFSGYDFLGGRLVNTGITAQAETLGYSLLLKEKRPSDDGRNPEWLQSLLSRHVDGILWTLHDLDAQQSALIEDVIARYGVPVVGLVSSPQRGFPVLSFDNHAAGMLATRHLIERGKRMIGLIGGPAGSWDAEGRMQGWRDALHAAGLPAEAAQRVHGDWGPASGDRMLRQLHAQCPGLDAVFAANDNMALGALHAAHELSLRIPQDVAVVGVDNIKGAEWFTPALTTVRHNQVDLGRRAVTALAELVEARFAGLPLPPIDDYLQAPELIVRASS